MPVVVVESPAKARTIEKFLGPGYRVLASFGHIRDLPEKDGSVDPEKEFAMEWEISGRAKERIKDISDALKKDNDLILATDPDREGEAISWHVREVLAKRRGVKLAGDAKRVVFNAITESAIQEAMRNPRTIDMELVDAYLARRALDYLVGYTLSPVLWRKLPGARSAGRVQSVCVRLIVERETEIESFKPREYWSIVAQVETAHGQPFFAKLDILDGAKLRKYDLASKEIAEGAAGAVRNSEFHVESLESKPKNRNPSAPFVTATLQQEASVKLRSNPRQTMRDAQMLYEAGLITYMRTDGIEMAPEAVIATRREIGRRFGERYLSKSRRVFRNKAKNAQEAHECIRPTNMSLDGADVKIGHAGQRSLYKLIWQRSIASQMESARYLQTTCDLRSEDGRTGLRATGSVIQFDGYQKVYRESRTLEGKGEQSANARTGSSPMTGERDGENAELPALAKGDRTKLCNVEPRQHFTQPPPRYTEASLVKKMVDLGIGRPSTYSSIVATIQERGYVRREQGSLYPQGIGRMVTGFLKTYFGKYVGYEFTAGLEEELDDVSGGRKKRLEVLERFWRDFAAAVGDTSELRIGEVLDRLSDILVPQLLPENGSGKDIRVCPKCGNGRLTLRTGRKSGAFLGCSSYPECQFVHSLDGGNADTPVAILQERLLGKDPETGLDVSARSGRFGPYLQLGNRDTARKKIKTVSIPKGIDPATLALETALALLGLPRVVGVHPEDEVPIEAGINRFGPFVRHGKKYATLADPGELLTLGMNRAVELLAQDTRHRRGPPTRKQLGELGEHPSAGGAIKLMAGRFGPYVNWNKINASLPKGTDPESLSLDQAVELIDSKRQA